MYETHKSAQAATAGAVEAVLENVGPDVGEMTKRAQKTLIKTSKVVRKEAAKTAKAARKETGRTSRAVRKEAARTARVARKETSRTSDAMRNAVARTSKVTGKEAARAAKTAKQEAARSAKVNKDAAAAAKKNGARAAKANGKVAKAEKKLVQADARAVEAATKSAKQAAKVRAKHPAGLLSQLTNPKTASRAMSVAKVVGPTLAPYALRAATTARGYLDERRALRLGVSTNEIVAYRGPTGPAGARIAGLRSSIEDLRRRRENDAEVSRFSDVANARLADLAVAVHTAGSMPPARRRATLTAVSAELDLIEADLMTYLVGIAG